MKSIIGILSALAVSLGGSAALAQGNSHYIVLSAIYSKPLHSDFTGLGNTTGQIAMKGGAGFLFAYGFGIAGSLALEAELSIRNSKTKSFTGGGVGSSAIRPPAKLSTLAFMFNGVFRTREVTPGIRPYFGAGIGVSQAKADGFDLTVNDVIAAIDGTRDSTIAHQFLGGVEVPLSDAMSARVGYRYFTTGTQDLGTIEAETRSHNLELGFVLAF